MTVLDVPGAHLFYETHGGGPLLIMIPGASGVSDSFRAVATHLAAHYTVVLYDRRGFSRSNLEGPQDYTRRLQIDADDVRRLIEHVGNAPATVFGASSGGIVVLDVLARYPEVVDTLVPFEPPAVLQLPDGKKWVDFFHEVYNLYRQAGIGPAMQKFREHAFPETDRQVMAQAPKNEANATYWFEHELRQYPPVELDLNTLTGRGDRILLAVGREAHGYPAHEVNLVQGRKLGRDVIELPGGHVGVLAHPASSHTNSHRLLRRCGRTDGCHRLDLRPRDQRDISMSGQTVSQRNWRRAKGLIRYGVRAADPVRGTHVDRGRRALTFFGPE